MVKELVKRLFNYLPFLGSVFRVLKSAGNFAANNLAALGLAGTVVGGVIATTTVNGKINNTNDRITEQVQIINQAGQDNTEELRLLLEAVSQDLRNTADLLEGELQQSFLTASANLQSTANRLDGEVLATNEDLTTTEDSLSSNLNSLKDDLEASDLSNKDELTRDLNQANDSLNTALTNVEAALQTQVTALQVQNNGLPPIGSIAWVVDPSLIDLNHYANCDGADINGNILPNVNADGLFVRGGVFDGLSNTDTTAVNGLAGTFFDNTSNPANVNITYYSAVATSGTGANNGVTGANDTVTFTGDSETSPVNFTLTCVVRYK